MEQFSESAICGKTDDQPRFALFDPEAEAAPSLTPALTPAPRAERPGGKTARKRKAAAKGKPMKLAPSGKQGITVDVQRFLSGEWRKCIGLPAESQVRWKRRLLDAADWLPLVRLVPAPHSAVVL